MAILYLDEGSVGVRVQKCPLEDGIYYDEYIKLGNRERRGVQHADRFISCEDGDEYALEICFNEGFAYGDYDIARAKLYHGGQSKIVETKDCKLPKDQGDGLKQDLIFRIATTRVRIGGQDIKDVRFAFRGLVVGK
jgi:hypothetical protein